MLAALIRVACLGILVAFVWMSWNRWASAGADSLRALRGYLVSRMPPFWVSWLYWDEKFCPAADNESQVAPQPAWKTALNNLSLVGITLICLLYVSRSELAEMFLEQGTRFDDGRRLRLLFLIAQWVGRRPMTTLLLSVVVGPASLGLYAFKVSTAARVTRARSIALAAAAICFVAFVVVGAVKW